MARQVAQGSLCYGFRPGDHVPGNHLLRRIDGLLDLGFVREALADSYSARGQPSIDPELMLRMLLVGYLFGIRSERRLCQEVHFNLAYRWFCRLDLGDAVPDHSTLSKNRHGRFRACDVYRLLFEQVVAQCCGRTGRGPISRRSATPRAAMTIIRGCRPADQRGNGRARSQRGRR